MPFNIALSGLNAASTDLNVISNNVANANTTGFKQSRAEFGDYFAANTYGLSSAAVGNGVVTERVAQQFGQGSINTTGNALDLAISGNGYFTLSDNGAKLYSRAGAFGTDKNGYVVNSSGQRLQVFPPVSGGASFDTANLRDLQLSTADNPPSATSSISADLNLPASATAPATAPFSPGDASSYNSTTSVTVYDSLGASHTGTLYFVKSATANTWDVHALVDGTELGTGSSISFDSSGVLTTPADGQISLPSFTPANGANALSMGLDLSKATQYGDSFSVGSLTQDGYATGKLVGIAIDTDGVVQARYSNGQATALGQVALTRFANPQGLQQLGKTGWAETFASGQPIRGSAGSGDFGLVQSGALEASNVDITEQLVNMITAQRNYQANAQVISVTDQLTQTIINNIR
jgi:flagellar hook protein FlgE